MATFSIGIQFQNNDVHTFNMTAQSFKQAGIKLDQYCAAMVRKYKSSDYYYKKSQIAADRSGAFCKDFPLIAITAKSVNGHAVITHHDDILYNVLGRK
jgi:hypothetical protein